MTPITKNIILSIIIALIFSIVGPSISEASSGTTYPPCECEEDGPTNFNPYAAPSSMEQVENYANQLEPYLSINEDGTFKLDPVYATTVDVPEDVLQEITDWMNLVNDDIKAGKAYSTENFEVHWYDTAEDIAAREQAAIENDSSGNVEPLAYDGRNAIETYWWGYRVYMDHELSVKTSYYITGSVLFTAAVNSWIVKFPYAPVWLIKGILGTLIAAYSFIAATIRYRDNGYGVYLRFTGKLPNTFLTGVYSQ